jgi:hypothetical protein
MVEWGELFDIADRLMYRSEEQRNLYYIEDLERRSLEIKNKISNFHTEKLRSDNVQKITELNLELKEVEEAMAEFKENSTSIFRNIDQDDPLRMKLLIRLVYDLNEIDGIDRAVKCVERKILSAEYWTLFYSGSDHKMMIEKHKIMMIEKHKMWQNKLDAYKDILKKLKRWKHIISTEIPIKYTDHNTYGLRRRF